MLWRTRDGYVIDIANMTDPHLQNAIAYMHRRIKAMNQTENAAWGCLSMLQGEMAQYTVECELSKMVDALDEATYRLKELEAEQKRRINQ